MIKINGEKNAKTRVKLRFGKTQVHKCKHTPVQGRIYICQSKVDSQRQSTVEWPDEPVI